MFLHDHLLAIHYLFHSISCFFVVTIYFSEYSSYVCLNPVSFRTQQGWGIWDHISFVGVLWAWGHHKYNDAQLWNVREARTLYSRLCQIEINYYWGYNRWMIAHTVISLYLPAFRGPPMSTQWLFRCWSTYRALDRSKYVLPQLTFWDLNPDMVNKPLLSLNHRKKVYCSWADTPPGSPPPSKIFLPANNNQRSDM